MEIVEKLQQRLKELEEFSKLSPAPVQINVRGKEYTIMPPSLYVVNAVEKKFTEISLKRLKTAQTINDTKEPDLEKLVSIFMENIEIAAEIVQIILDGKPVKTHVVSKEELMNEWSVFDLVKVFKAYEYLVDVSDFFQSFRIPIAKL